MDRVTGTAYGLSDASVAIVVADGWETTYLRAGRGQTVLVLVDPQRAAVLVNLLPTLAASFRLVIPVPPAGPASLGWLVGVVDGLGISSAGILADPVYAPWAHGLAAERPDRICGVAELATTSPQDVRSVVQAVGQWFGSGTQTPPAGI